MKKARKAKWNEKNLMAAAGIRDLKNYKVQKITKEYMIIFNKKTGNYREIELEGKEIMSHREEDWISESLARSMRGKNMRFKIELENGDICTGTLNDTEVEYLQERITVMESYRKKYGSTARWSIAQEIAHGIIHEWIAEHKNDR